MHITLIGAGPRGLMLLGRLISLPVVRELLETCACPVMAEMNLNLILLRHYQHLESY